MKPTIQVGGVTVVPAARISGRRRRWWKQRRERRRGGRKNARPVAVYVIRDGDARWRPAVDVDRVVLGGQLIALAAILSVTPLLKRWLLLECSVGRAPNRVAPVLPLTSLDLHHFECIGWRLASRSIQGGWAHETDRFRPCARGCRQPRLQRPSGRREQS